MLDTSLNILIFLKTYRKDLSLSKTNFNHIYMELPAITSVDGGEVQFKEDLLRRQRGISILLGTVQITLYYINSHF